VWILEMPIIGPVVLYILKKDNLINKVHACIPLQNPLYSWRHRILSLF
jgi:hypothetical protein